MRCGFGQAKGAPDGAVASTLAQALAPEIDATYIANMSDPRIPAALAPAVAGIVSLNDFRPRAMHRRANFTFASGGDTNQALTRPGLGQCL